MRFSALARTLASFLALLLAGSALAAGAHAQSTPEGMIDSVIDSYRDLGQLWYQRFLPPVQYLYASLVTAQGVFFFGNLAILHRTNQHHRAAMMISRSMWFVVMAGIGGVLIANADHIVNFVWSAFVQAAMLGMPFHSSLGLAPGEAPSPSFISTLGLKMGDQMLEAATNSDMLGFLQFFNSFTPWLLVIAYGVISLAYVGIAIQIAITQVAFFIALGVSPFFCMFIAFPQFSGILDGYFNFLIYISIKIFFLYLLLGVAVSIPAAAMEMFPNDPETLPEYYGLITASGNWVWDAGSWGEVMEPTGVTRAALTLVMACVSVLVVMATVPITFARMISQRFSLNSASWWS